MLVGMIYVIKTYLEWKVLIYLSFIIKEETCISLFLHSFIFIYVSLNLKHCLAVNLIPTIVLALIPVCQL